MSFFELLIKKSQITSATPLPCQISFCGLVYFNLKKKTTLILDLQTYLFWLLSMVLVADVQLIFIDTFIQVSLHDHKYILLYTLFKLFMSHIAITWEQSQSRYISITGKKKRKSSACTVWCLWRCSYRDLHVKRCLKAVLISWAKHRFC